jgi:hypothetical protein
MLTFDDPQDEVILGVFVLCGALAGAVVAAPLLVLVGLGWCCRTLAFLPATRFAGLGSRQSGTAPLASDRHVLPFPDRSTAAGRDRHDASADQRRVA